MYSSFDKHRIYESPEDPDEQYRTVWRVDYARLIHSPSFRRLQGKTQLFPGVESDFFRNRLTHSLEVAQIAKSIALKINHTHLAGKGMQLEPDICEIAGLAHDLGHPPFGHQGEEALDECMRNEGGFEGNAQTLRILAKLEKKIYNQSHPIGFDESSKDLRVGLNLTYRTLASILKYDKEIPYCENQRNDSEKNRAVKGYYSHERELVCSIKQNVIGDKDFQGFKTVECQVMDIADDIAYSTYDLEDGMKAGFYGPYEIILSNDELIEKIRVKVSNSIGKVFSPDEIKDGLFGIFGEIFEVDIQGTNPEDLKALSVKISTTAFNSSRMISSNGYLRNTFSSGLVGEFVKGVEFKLDEKYPALSKVNLNAETRFKVELLKTFTFESQILSPKLKIAEYRGKEIVREIFRALTTDDGWRLMPQDFQELYSKVSSQLKNRIICDFISGMTDRYAIEFYGRLKSENPETIFKPY